MRSRYSDYYLSRIDSRPVVLYPNGQVGSLESQKVTVTEMLPTRVEGRLRPTERTVERMAQATIYESLADYVAHRNDTSVTAESYGTNPDWTLDDIPPEVVAEYEKWRDQTNLPDIESIRSAAKNLIADGERLDDLVKCPDCTLDSEYACYSCGYSRYFYKYPLVRFDAESDHQDVPLDIAKAVVLNPESISIESSYEIKYQRLRSSRKLVFYPDRITGEYCAGTRDNAAVVDRSDALHEPLEITLDSWSEDETMASGHDAMIRSRYLRDAQDPEDYIKSLQNYASKYVARERPGGEQYEEKYQAMLAKVGRAGLALTFGLYYAGMGESDYRFKLVDPERKYQVRSVLTYSGDARMAIDDAYRALVKP